MSDSQFNWKQILVSAFITAVFALIVGILLYNYQNSEPILSYTFYEGLPFEGDGGNIAIYSLVISNDGKKIIEDITANIEFSGGELEQIKVDNKDSININEIKNISTYSANILNMNPKERLKINFLVNEKNGQKEPSISIRGKGVKGLDSATLAEKNKITFLGITIDIFDLLVAVLSAIIFAIILFLTSKTNLKTELTDDYKQSAEQSEIFFYLANLHNLEEEKKYYSHINKKVSYWSEADRISFSVENDNKDIIKKKKQLLIDLIDYASINYTSKAIIYYDIARISKILKQSKDVEEYLSKAKHIESKLIEKRIKLDKIWK